MPKTKWRGRRQYLLCSRHVMFPCLLDGWMTPMAEERSLAGLASYLPPAGEEPCTPGPWNSKANGVPCYSWPNISESFYITWKSNYMEVYIPRSVYEVPSDSKEQGTGDNGCWQPQREVRNQEARRKPLGTEREPPWKVAALVLQEELQQDSFSICVSDSTFTAYCY